MLSFAKTNNNILETSYFKKLPTSTLDSFVDSQTAFYYAVENWSKVLALCLSKTDDIKERMVLVKNLWDEHGNGDEYNSHVNTFKRFLDSLDVKNNRKLNEQILVHVEDFNEQLIHAVNTRSKDYYYAMLGMIEYCYIDASRELHSYATNYIDPAKIIHYSLHEIVDVEHARELFSIVVNNHEAHQGALHDHAIFEMLYESMAMALKEKEKIN